MQIIKDLQVTNDQWQLATLGGPNASYPVASEFDSEESDHALLEYGFWKKINEALKIDSKGIYLTPEDTLDIQPKDLKHLELIAIVLPKNDPTKGFSLVNTLRNALHYKGEIRAINVNALSATAAIKGGFDSIGVA